MRRTLGILVVGLALTAYAGLLLAQGSPAAGKRTFATPDEAVRALMDAVKRESLDDLLGLFGQDGRDLIDSSDVATARQNRQVFAAAAAEGWRLVDQAPNTKQLVVGNEAWPFPIPLVKRGNTWYFDTAAGKEEVIDRRIGRNELTAIAVCHTYVDAQRHYAKEGHDGKPAGLFAATFRSDSGKQNGLYWVAARHEPPSPLGDLLAQAALEERRSGSDAGSPAPFHGYYFKILTAQGASAPGGAKSYVVNGELSGGFALIAWPAQYDATGVMTFLIGQDNIVRQKDLGPDTDRIAAATKSYNPDASWRAVN
jgi:hypothetical protein